MNKIFIGNIKGEKGDTGTGLKILGYYATVEELSSAIPSPSIGDTYGVGSSTPYDIYVYSNNGWVNNGALQPDINEQTPNYAEATTLESLTSGEKISIAFGKIKKAITDLISHLADTTKHITSAERTSWNDKAPGGYGLGTILKDYGQITFTSMFKQGTGFYQLDSAPDTPADSPMSTPMIQLSSRIADDGERGIQLVMPDRYIDNPKIYYRAMFNGEIGEWYQLLHSGNADYYRNKIVTGVYTGDSAASRTISLDFTPDIVIVFGKSGISSFLTPDNGYRGCGGMAFKDYPCAVGSIKTIEIVTNGFNVAYTAPNGDSTANVPMTNENGAVYYYMAIRKALL